MSRIVVENNRLVLEFEDPDKLSKFVELIKLLGGGNFKVERREIVIRYNECFLDYLLKDRELDERTAKDYMRYLKKLNDKVVNYDLYLEISGNKWLVKTVRLYLDYIYKKGEISWEEYQKLKGIFRVKKRVEVNNHRIDEEELIGVLYDERLREEESVVFELLLYSGARFSEIIKLINDFDESRIECFDEFCRYGMFWMRGRKRCDWIYIPVRLVDKLRKYKGYYGGRKVHSLSRYFEKKYSIDLKLFRKLFYRICRQESDKEICDFIESRISKLSIGDIHYDDLLTRADEEYPKIIEKINQLIDEIKEGMSIGILINEGEITEVQNGDLVIKLDEEFEEDVSTIERKMWEYHIEV